MSQIPKASATDSEDVVWALQTSDALWKRGEYMDSIAWLRRAAQAAGEAEDDERALALAHYAAELAEWHDSQRTETTNREEYDSTVVEISVSGAVPISDEDYEEDEEESKLPSFAMDVADGTPNEDTTTAVAPKDLYSNVKSEMPEEIHSVAPEDITAEEGDETMAGPRPEIPKPPPVPQKRPSRSAMAAVQGPPVAQKNGDAVPALVPVPFEPPETDLQVQNPDDTGLQQVQATPGSAPPAQAAEASSPTGSLPPPRQQFPTAPYNSSVPPPDVLAQEISDLRRARSQAPAEEVSTSEGEGPLDLEGVDAFADLPDDEREAFARKANIVELQEGAEVPFSALAYIVSGEVEACASVADAPAMTLKAGEVLRNRGTIDATISLRLIASSESAKVACWATEEVEEAFRACSWVEDDLRERANRILAMCGVGVGVLGERLDADLRQQVASRMDIKVYESGDTIVEKGKPVPGLLLVGFGDVELEGGSPASCGDFLYQEAALGAGAASVTTRAGKNGAVLLTATRSVTQELLATCPPLVEILAGF
ncbi:MAG: hypothetical protein U0174_22140 [Polyangiaceae bacterium]